MLFIITPKIIIIIMIKEVLEIESSFLVTTSGNLLISSPNKVKIQRKLGNREKRNR